MKYRNRIITSILLIFVFFMSIEIINPITASPDDFSPDDLQYTGNFDEILEDEDRIITPSHYLRAGDSIHVNLTVIPYLDQKSGVVVETHTPDGVVYSNEVRTEGVKILSESVLLNVSSTEGRYWFEIVNPGFAGGDEMRVFGQSFYYADTLPDWYTAPYDVWHIGDWLNYEIYEPDMWGGNWRNVKYTVNWLIPDYIQFENDDTDFIGWSTVILNTTHQPFSNDFYDDITGESNDFLPFNYNLSVLEELLSINPVFYDTQNLIQTDSNTTITEDTKIVNGTIIDYIITIKYVIVEMIPVKGVTWTYKSYNDSDETWANYSVQLEIHELTGIPIYLDLIMSTTTGGQDRYIYRLIDSQGVFEVETTDFSIENINGSVIFEFNGTEYITEYITIIEYVNDTKYVTEYVTVYITEYVTGDTSTSAQSTFGFSMFTIGSIVILYIWRKRKVEVK